MDHFFILGIMERSRFLLHLLGFVLVLGAVSVAGEYLFKLIVLDLVYFKR